MSKTILKLERDTGIISSTNEIKTSRDVFTETYNIAVLKYIVHILDEEIAGKLEVNFL